MSAFELRLPLPCDQALWEAASPRDWLDACGTCPPEPMFLLALKSYLTPDVLRPTRLNGLSRIILFHGLMSIFWDMQRRDQTSLGVIASQTGRWQTRLEEAYRLWKFDFDRFCDQLAVITDLEISKEAANNASKVEFNAWRTAYLAVYYAANILLRSDFLDIQIYAGARHILGKAVQRCDYVRSERVVKRWASSGWQDQDESGVVNAAIATRHASRLLKIASRSLVDYDSMGLFHVPWCLYLATLTIWAFHHVGSRGSGVQPDEDGEMVWDAQAEMTCLIDSMAETEPETLLAMQGTKRTGALVWVMAGALGKVRWGIVHAGVTVLRGLVPWRLIGEFEGSV